MLDHAETALAALTLCGHSSVMPERYSVNNASRSQEGTTLLRLLLLLQKKSLQPGAFLLLFPIMLGSHSRQVFHQKVQQQE